MALPELVTRSVIDVVTENFDRVGLKAFACRAVYAGDHSLSRDQLVEVFRESVESANAQYCDVPLSGLLLAYEGFFVHVLEGSEDTINRQLRFLLQRAREHDAGAPADRGDSAPPASPAADASELKMFKRLKLLMVYHSIRQTTIKEWGAVSAKPPTLVTKLDPYGPMALHMEQLATCLCKIDRLCALYKTDHQTDDDWPNPSFNCVGCNSFQLSFEGLSASDPKMEVLPEFVLLELLLDSKHVVELRTYNTCHRRVDDYTFYYELVWPPPTHYTPRHLYKLKVDDTFVEPLPQQEWQLREREQERERDDDEEPASSGDSSD